MEFADQLLTEFTPQQVATAFLRLSRAGKSAPEDIQLVSVDGPARREFRDDKGAGKKGGKASRDFAESLWVSISVGRKQNAEPRWLIPLMCNAGGLTKSDIGYIRIEQNQTHIELDANQADRFLEAMGSNMTLEKNVRVKVLEAKPDFDASARPGKRKKFGDDRPFKSKGGKFKSGPPQDKAPTKHRKGSKPKPDGAGFKEPKKSANAAPAAPKRKKKRKTSE